MKKGRTSEVESFRQKEEPLAGNKSKLGSLSSESVNPKLIPKNIEKPIAGKKTATATVSKPAGRNISTSQSFPIVGIGASAGGLEAMEQFFTNMPKDSGMAFVVIQSVLINQEGDILNFIGRTSKYLEHAAGKANMNIYAMAREGLRNELAGAIRKAKQNYEPVSLRNIKVGNNEDAQIVNVTFQAIENPGEVKGTIMIVFTDVTALQKPVSRKSKTVKQTSTARENELEIDLQHTIGELQNIREEMQTSQEELKSTNEELQSTNEELQSTNEELTTSKEEMQSMNEELLTVNIELQSKIADFIAIESDMKNLLNSTDIATLFLDKELNIRKFTEKLINIIKLRPSDIGRPFNEMVSDLQYPEIANHAREVLRTLISKESDISTNDQRWFTVRIMPYRRLDNKIDGVVMTFIDITIAKILEAKLAAANIEEKEKQLAELAIANKELEFQNKEKQKRADELAIANKELIIQNKEKENLKAELTKTISILHEHNLYKP